MPKSRVRRKAAFTPPPAPRPSGEKLRTRLAAPLMVIFFVAGLAWIVVYYIAGSDIPGMSSLGNWNLVLGFGLLGCGFACATQWR